jgi:tRNA (uracil-5-)-methyltransferase
MHFTSLPVDQYDAILDKKVSGVMSSFGGLALPSPAIYPSAPEHYRMRAEFRLWHEDDDLYYAMFDPADPKIPIRIDHFPVAGRAIAQLMPRLIESIKGITALRQRLFQIEFLSTLAGDMLVTLIYHRKLDAQWEDAAKTLSEALSISMIGRSRKQRIVLDKDYVLETLNIDGQDYQYRQYEGGFTQPNAELNQKMIAWAGQHLGQRPKEDLLELYCGNGNFTAPLSKRFRKVLATEISKTSVRAAKENFALNRIENVSIARMSSEDFTSALNGEREFRRLAGINLKEDYRFSAIFIDPPRAGLDDDTRQLVSRFDNILYISCNPETLRRDLQLLTKSHTVEAFALFDQFPYTNHMECGAFLQRI